jgi:hypothetical protein
VTLLPNASYLKLEKEKFIICIFFRKYTYKWNETQDFFVNDIGRLAGIFGYPVRSKIVMFYHSNIHRFPNRLQGLPDTYGMKPEKLADLMNNYKKNSNV